MFGFVEQARVFADEMSGAGLGGSARRSGDGGRDSGRENGQGGEKGVGGEEVRLLRLRTRKEEIVIYPGVWP